MKKSNLILILCLLTTPLWAKNPMRPMSEMHGNCQNFKMPIQSQIAVLKKSPALIVSNEIAWNKPLRFALEPQKEVKFIAKPEKEKSGDFYARVLRFQVPKKGSYRILSQERLWLDVVDAKKSERIDAKTFEMQTDCPTVVKAVEFELSPGTEYALQLSGSESREATILLSSE